MCEKCERIRAEAYDAHVGLRHRVYTHGLSALVVSLQGPISSLVFYSEVVDALFLTAVNKDAARLRKRLFGFMDTIEPDKLDMLDSTAARALVRRMP